MTLETATDTRPLWRRQPRIVMWLVGAIVLAHIVRVLLPLEIVARLFELFAVIPVRFDGAAPEAFASPALWVLPVVGHGFLHAGVLHVLFNVLILVQASGPVVARLGEGRYLAVLLASAAGAAGAYVALNAGSSVPAIGASGAVCGVFAAYLLAATPNPSEALRVPEVRRAAFWFLVVNVGLAALARATGVLPIAWEAHLGGFLAGLCAFMLLAKGDADPSISSR